MDRILRFGKGAAMRYERCLRRAFVVDSAFSGQCLMSDEEAGVEGAMRTEYTVSGGFEMVC